MITVHILVSRLFLKWGFNSYKSVKEELTNEIKATS
ncbi:hypothetical protein SAMN05880501_103246 [Ureibacillus xyleni]|uniref:Uncharacterized protein n=1 Tax=Ureibacillus xyleni TaxID=614648 RepID=A0A285S7C2_9BACL|nr:hypothetical protein SAMN05880501_103246 [Ureibacillus xyleni]